MQRSPGELARPTCRRSSKPINIGACLNVAFYEQGQPSECEMSPPLPSSPQAISFLNGILER